MTNRRNRQAILHYLTNMAEEMKILAHESSAPSLALFFEMARDEAHSLAAREKSVQKTTAEAAGYAAEKKMRAVSEAKRLEMELVHAAVSGGLSSGSASSAVLPEGKAAEPVRHSSGEKRLSLRRRKMQRGETGALSPAAVTPCRHYGG